MAGFYRVPISSPSGCIELGDAKLFTGNGAVVLGNAAFNCFTPIPEHHYSGCTATRGEDGILTIKTPVETYRYFYNSAALEWYQLVPDKSEETPSQCKGQLRSNLRDYGTFGGYLAFVVWLVCQCILGGIKWYCILMGIFVFIWVVLTPFIIAAAFVCEFL